MSTKIKPDNIKEEAGEGMTRKKDHGCHGSEEATNQLNKNFEFFTEEQGRPRPTTTLQTKTVQTSRQKNLQELEIFLRNRLS